MSRKDYQLLANALRRSLIGAHDNLRPGIALAAQYIADALEQENPRFNPTKFLRAAGF